LHYQPVENAVAVYFNVEFFNRLQPLQGGVAKDQRRAPE
jgi:hypothetical protein